LGEGNEKKKNEKRVKKASRISPKRGAGPKGKVSRQTWREKEACGGSSSEKVSKRQGGRGGIPMGKIVLTDKKQAGGGLSRSIISLGGKGKYLIAGKKGRAKWCQSSCEDPCGGPVGGKRGGKCSEKNVPVLRDQ